MEAHHNVCLFRQCTTKTIVSNTWSTQFQQIQTYIYSRHQPCQLRCLQRWGSSCLGGSIRPPCFPQTGLSTPLISGPKAMSLNGQEDQTPAGNKLSSTLTNSLTQTSVFKVQLGQKPALRHPGPCWPCHTHINPQETHWTMSTLPSFNPSLSPVVKFGTVDSLK